MEPATRQDIEILKKDIGEMVRGQTKTILDTVGEKMTEQTKTLLTEIDSFRQENTREHEATKTVTEDHEQRIITLERVRA